MGFCIVLEYLPWLQKIFFGVMGFWSFFNQGKQWKNYVKTRKLSFSGMIAETEKISVPIMYHLLSYFYSGPFRSLYFFDLKKTCKLCEVPAGSDNLCSGTISLAETINLRWLDWKWFLIWKLSNRNEILNDFSSQLWMFDLSPWDNFDLTIVIERRYHKY